MAALRARKHREDKPFALMVARRGTRAALVELGPHERELLLRSPRGRSCSRRGCRMRRSRASVAPGAASSA